MQNRASAENNDPKAASELSLAGPINLLSIGAELARMAEDRNAAGRRTRDILAYVLRLTNGVGVSYLEVNARQLSWRDVIWRETKGGFQDAMLEEINDVVRRALAKSIVMVEPLAIKAQHFVITVPVSHGGKLRGVVNLVLAAPSLEDIQPFVAVLQTALGFLHYGLLQDETYGQRHAVEQTAALVELASLVAAAPFYEESVRILTERVQKHLGCHQAALGLVGRKKVKLASVSGAAKFDARGNLTLLIESAMQDAVLAEDLVRWPRPPDDPRGRADLTDVAQQELHHALDLDQVCSVPLRRADGRMVAVLTLMWRADQKPTVAADRFIEAAAPHLGSLLGALRRADPGNARKWWHHLWTSVSKVKKVLVIAAVVLLLGLLAMPVRFPVKVDATIEPVLRRVVPAQFDGILKESMVKPGDLVKKGDLLAMMDDKQLRWKQAELVASRDKAIRQRDLAMADPRAPVASAQMSQLEADGLDLELKLLAFKQENLELRAPFDGMVLVGDLERAQGIPVNQGDVLFEIGPVNQMITELMIPAYDVSLVKPGDEVSLRLSSFPGENWTTKISKIRPQAESIDGKTIFVAEASLVLAGADDPVLRAGMKGRASIRGEEAPLGWVLTRRLWGYLQTTLFW
jgi:multidrug resistance efflux pump